MKKYNSYKPSGIDWIGEIPVSWNTTKLKYFLDEIITGGTPDTSNDEYWIDNGINWISISDITSSPDGILKTKKTISEEGRKSKNLKVLEPNSLIYSIYGSIGKVNRIKVSSTIHQGILSFITNKKLNNYYLEKYLIFLQPFISSFSSSNTQDNLNQDKIKNLFIQVPPLQEQEQIVEYLDEKTTIIDKLISTKEKKIELLKEQRTSLINEVITKGLNPNVKMKDSGVEWIGDIPENWNISKLKYFLSEIITGGTPDTSIDEYWVDNGINWISISDITSSPDGILETKKTISEDGRRSKNLKVLEPNSLIYSIYGSIGKVNRIKVSSTIHQGILSFITNDKLNNYFLEKYLIFIQPFISSFSSSNTQDNLNQDKIKNLFIQVPPLQEQEQIVEYLDKHTKEIDDLVSMEQNKIELLKEYRQSLISEVITGKIKVV